MTHYGLGMSDLHARQEITELLVQYATAIDGRDWDLLRRTFTADCALDYGDLGVWHGIDEVVDYMDRAHVGIGHSLHRITNPTIVVDGDRATSRSYLDGVLMSPDGKSGIHPIGVYDDGLVATDDGWRIAERRFTMIHLGTLGG